MKKHFFLVIFVLTLNLFSGVNVWANDMNYSVKAQIPVNQVDKKLTYFDLQVTPNMEQELKVSVTNSSKEKAIIKLEANNALTNSNGVIEYTKHGAKPDSSLRYPFESLIVDPEQKVILKSGETKDVTFHLHMPKNSIKGMILGGIHITKEDEKSDNNKKNVTIQNMYSYVIGVKIRENLVEENPTLTLNRIKPTLLNYRTAICANLQNPTPVLMHKVNIDADVRKKNSNNVLHQVKNKQINIAPNTNFDFPIPWENQEIEPGVYTLTMHITSNQGQWDFKKDFVIKGNDVKNVNNEAVEVQRKSYIVEYILISIIFMLIVGFFLLNLFSKNKKNRDSDLLQ